MPNTKSTQKVSPTWSPLNYPIFRNMWIAVTVSNIGSWMHNMAAGWLMTNLTESSLMVALIQTATALPFFLFALPAGTLADIINRRSYLLTMVWGSILSGMLLAAITFAGLASPWLLLALIFLLSAGNAMMRPALTATIPDLVPKSELGRAVTLNSMSLNLSRAIGPVLAGLLILSAGPGMVFLVNALTFIALAIAIYKWPTSLQKDIATLPLESFKEGMKTGIRYARNAPLLQVVLLKSGVFLFFGSVIWALLPVIAIRELNGGPTLYGLFFTFIGVGAIVATQIMTPLHKRFSRNTILSSAVLIYAVSLWALGNFTNILVLCVTLLISGGAWLAMTASLATASQRAVPDWVRARGLAMVMLTMTGSTSIGSMLWGYLADRVGVSQAIVIASIGLALSVIATLRVRINDTPVDLSPSRHYWPELDLSDAHSNKIELNGGKIMITLKFIIQQQNQRDFLQLSKQLEQIRRRDGAIYWELFKPIGLKDHYIEVFMMSSWLEYLRQQERLTIKDKTVQDKILALHHGKDNPEVSYLIS